VKANESKKMAVFVADAQAMDYNIGVLGYLKKIGEYDNTYYYLQQIMEGTPQELTIFISVEI
jgi:hypothetical protein